MEERYARVAKSEGWDTNPSWDSGIGKDLLYPFELEHICQRIVPAAPSHDGV